MNAEDFAGLSDEEFFLRLAEEGHRHGNLIAALKEAILLGDREAQDRLVRDLCHLPPENK